MIFEVENCPRFTKTDETYIKNRISEAGPGPEGVRGGEEPSPVWSSMYIYIYIGVRGGARTGYLIPGCDGDGAWTRPENSSVAAAAAVRGPTPGPSRDGIEAWARQEILPSPPSPSSSPPSPKMRLFDKSQILSILTHSRDTDALLPPK